LQERIHDFERSDEEVQLRSILDGPTARPRSISATAMEPKSGSPPWPADLAWLSLTPSRPSIPFKTINPDRNPDRKEPQTKDWERAFRLFDLLMWHQRRSMEATKRLWCHTGCTW